MTNHGTLPLRDKVAVVTGGGRGIGLAISRRLAEMGAHTILCGRSQATLDSAAQEIRSAGGQCEAMVGDVADLSSVETIAARV
ncbi:MAG: SDR family NAD(P)-dependent oxidoreductase, partial [Terriglobales bacterium]